MTKENKQPDFASDVAGEYWAQQKAEYGDAIDINDVQGGGKNGAIRKEDIQEYIESLTGDDADEVVDDGSQADAETVSDDQDTIESDDEGNDQDDSDEDDADLDETTDADDADEGEEMVKGYLVNNTDNVFEIEDVKIEPKGKTPLTPILEKSKRVKYACEIGTLGIE